MNRNPEKDHFKKEMDHYISPHSMFTGVDRNRILERIERAKRRKKWWGNPKMALSILLLFIVAGSLYVLINQSNQEEVLSAQEVIDTLYVGMSQEEVWSYLGTDYLEVEPSKDSGPKYELHRYDYPLKEGYEFITSIDELDIEGVKTGMMGMQVSVFIDSNNHVAGYSVLYKNNAGKTLIHSVWGEKVEEIAP
ncbi:hypothetical protein [Sutcliffiella rhizosphaerae]|uniref:DUF4830 domain-containing protein n=1 Tax=Sutcliffiella rhizosphaerae TaxID=2880967 RepID=A0ABN8ADC3_9BACI|nr:hypothetical protein [Sutcliffiella rhizosphaerae]CAG9621472.1 hypothetical protein BACCIP111883_02245 [Sutcliffiella rhizosphaerae]